jgi:hypothetical protein
MEAVEALLVELEAQDRELVLLELVEGAGFFPVAGQEVLEMVQVREPETGKLGLKVALLVPRSSSLRIGNWDCLRSYKKVVRSRLFMTSPLLLNLTSPLRKL